MICMSPGSGIDKKRRVFSDGCVLAGMKEASETDRIYEGEELADEMMVFAGVTGSHLDQILFMMRKKGMKRIDYKAVLTDTNSQWTVPELFKELKRSMRANASVLMSQKNHIFPIDRTIFRVDYHL